MIDIDSPPVSHWSRTDTVSFIIVCTLAVLFIEVALLWAPGFSNALLFGGGIWGAFYSWPKIGPAIKNWWYLRKFKKSIPDGMEQHK